jgi:beta-galactosidase
VIDIRRKRIVVDGSPRILMSGEVHYFRLSRDDWADRLDATVAAGCDTVASYIPWLCHEKKDGTFDLDGRTRPELDLGAFIDACRDRGLSFFARPGPFIMAELKNEGLPYRIYDEHPEIQPVTWDGKPVSTRTVDYLAPAYLAEVRKWYAAVMPVLAPRLVTNGGNVLAVQLDNEVGMLSWVSNSPDLTDKVLADFAGFLHEEYDDATLAARYPFDFDDPRARAAGIRSPHDDYAPALMADLGRSMRRRFARYIATLREYAEAEGVRDIPFVVNIHGTSDGRGTTYPIGISQLMESFAGIPGVLAGSDHYLGDLTTRNAADLYLINAFGDAVQDADQPLTSVEFEAGDGDYGRDLTHVHDPSTIDLKTRLCVAQGNRLINYYLFTGGVNPRLDAPVGDGNDRISFTGERHGVGAPVGPEGQLGLTYPRTAEVVHTIQAVAGKLATMDEERDDVAMAFVPDYFMTESVYPGSAPLRDMVDNLERHRFGGPEQLMARALLLGGYRFGALDLQAGDLTPDTTPVLALASASYLDAGVQERLVRYLDDGGRLLLCGEVPSYDLERRSCTLLRDALGLSPRGLRLSDHAYFLSVCAQGWAGPRPEVRVSYAQMFDAARGETVLYDYDTGAGCGFDIGVGAGRAVVLTTDYPGSDVAFYRTAVEVLGARPALTHDADRASLVITSTRGDDDERFLHALNLDGYDTDFVVHEDGHPLLGGHRIAMAGRQGLMLPIDLRLGDGVRLAYATAEIAGLERDAVVFRARQPGLVAAFETDRTLAVQWPSQVQVEDGLQVVQLAADPIRDQNVAVRWS